MKPFDPRLLRQVPAARGPVAALGVLGTVQGLVAIGQALAVAALVVAVVQGGPLAAPAAWTVGLFGLRGLLAGLGQVVATWAGSRVAGGLRAVLARALLARPADDRPDPARANALLDQGVTSVEPYVAHYLPTLVAAAVLPTAAIVAMGLIDWTIALVPVLTVPLLPLFAALIGRTTADATGRRWRAMASLSGHYLDVMRGLPTLAAYGRAEHQATNIATVSQRLRHATVATLRLAFLSSAALELLASLSVAIVAVFVGLRLATGSMELAVGLPLILLAPEAYWPIRRVGAEFHAAADGAEAIDDILAELAADAVRPSPATGVAVRVDDLDYRHAPGAPPVLAGVTLRAGPGLTVVTGASGAGKTTLLELVAGLRRPVAGSVTAPAAHLVTQRPVLVAGSVADNLRLGLDRPAADDELWAALDRVGLAEVVARLPERLATRLGDEGFGLSAGQRARLALARALLSSRPVLLLDEPTAHLDAEAAALVHATIRDLARERVVIAASHDPGLVALAERRLDLEPVRTGDGEREDHGRVDVGAGVAARGAP